MLHKDVVAQIDKVKKGESKTAYLCKMMIEDVHMPQLCKEFEECGRNLEIIMITSSGIDLLFRYLESNDTVSKLHLGGNKFGDDGARFAARMLGRNKTLSELTLGSVHGGCDITDDGIIFLARSLIGNTTLNELDFWNNSAITEKAVPALRDMMENSHILDRGSETDLFFLTAIPEDIQAELKLLAQVPFAKRTFPLLRKAL